MSGQAQRQGGVDAGRLIGAFLVILLHCLPNPAFQPAPSIAVLLVGTAARVAVPFFFVTSGLFLRVRAEPVEATARRTIGRLLPLYLFWLALYLMVFSAPLPSYAWEWKPSVLWTGGPGFQLWFLPALGVSQWLVAAAVPRIGLRPTTLLAGSIALAGLWIVYGLPPHHPLPFWLPRLCQGPVLVLAGHLLARGGWRIGAAPAALLCALAFGAALGENGLVAAVSGRPITYQEFDVSTGLFGIAAALLARAPGMPAFPERWQPARLSLRLYCVHVLFLWPLIAWIGIGPLLPTLALFTGVSGLSLAAALLLGRVRGLERIAG